VETHRPTPKPPFTTPLVGEIYPIHTLTHMRASEWTAQMALAPSYAVAHPALAEAILSGITHGVDIGFDGARDVTRHSRNLRSALDGGRIEQMVSDIIFADVAAGKKAGPFDDPPFEHFSYSPIGAVMKGGTWDRIRVIHHLSFPFGGDSINANVRDEDLVLGRFDNACDAIRQLGSGCFLIKLDVEAAYKQVPVRVEDRALLGLQWNGKFYYELTLPFGLKSSGVRWELYAAALHYFFRHHLGVELVIHYVDDFLFVVAEFELAKRQMTEALAMARRLGAPFADDKAEGPLTCLVFLGIELDTVTMSARLPDKRLTRLRLLLKGWTGRRTCSILDLQQLTGKLHNACHIVRAGRPFVRRLIGLTTALCKQRGVMLRDGVSQQHTLTREARQDVLWWHRFIAQWNGRSLLYEREWQTAVTMHLYTDACYSEDTGEGGYGAHWGNRWFQGTWIPEQLQLAWRVKRHSVPFLELYTLVLAARTWGPHWAGRKIVFHTDCQGMSFACGKMSSPDSSVQALLRYLAATGASCGFDFRVVHIAGVLNTVADALSRACTYQELRVLLPDALPLPETLVPLPPLKRM
jgi:hypothetical protein